METASHLPGYIFDFLFEILTYRKLTTSIAISEFFLVKILISCCRQGFPNGFSSTTYVTKCVTNTHLVSYSIVHPQNIFRQPGKLSVRFVQLVIGSGPQLVNNVVCLLFCFFFF